MFRRGVRTRALRPAGYEAAMRLALADPVTNALPGSRLAELGRSPLQLGQEFAVHGREDSLDGLLWNGVNVAPIEAGERALEAFGRHLASQRRRAGSLVGPQAQLQALWGHMDGLWGPVREFRWSQPLLLATVPAEVPVDERVHPALPSDADLVIPAAVAMFREEVGLDPLAHDGGRGYRRRVDQLIAAGRTYVVIDEVGGRRQVVFKADVGALFGDVAQLHGVWVAPDARGRGIARRAMAAVVHQVRRDHAPRVSLYVNDFNAPARRAYAASGFRQVGELATVLF